MGNPVKVLLLGLGGYGMYYVNYFLDQNNLNLPFVVCAGVDPVADICSRLVELKQRDIPIYADIDEALTHHNPDLVIISTPIHTHLPLSKKAMASGANVLLEKPLCGSLSQADQLLNLSKDSQGFLTIGYQSSFSPATAQFIQDLEDGRFGELLSLKTLALRPRDKNYFKRSSWAGACYAPNGDPVFDGPAMNANAHSLFFQLMVSEMCSPGAIDVTACSLIRANDIANHDSVACTFTSGGIPHLFLASHSVDGIDDVRFSYTFSNAEVCLNSANGMEARFADGTVEVYGSTGGGHEKIEACLAAVLNGTKPMCNLPIARKHIAVIEQIQQFPVHSVLGKCLHLSDD